MTQLTPTATSERQKIQRYGQGRFTVSGTAFTGSVLVLPRETVPWVVTDILAIPAAAMNILIERAQGLDLCIIGCGPRVVMLAPAVRAAFKAASLHVELMDTGSACRTFNVLTAENRAVGAALIAI
ncbi:MAG: Mth938-like domain-containing protein [Rhodospirillaceae bacterium]|nr:Mth938-like domain-containing protein [Rhodospirillaceae bacterium]